MKPIQAAILMADRTNSTVADQHEYSREGGLKILTFTVSSDAKDLDDDEGDKENSNPHGLSIC